MKVVGLTGPTGSGKGYISRIFEKHSAFIVDTDLLVHSLYRGGRCAEQIGDAFGADRVLSKDGSVNRLALGEIVFNNRECMAHLQAIVYRHLSELTDKILAEKENSGTEIAVIDAPMLFEATFDKKCDFILSVVAERTLRIDRIMKRDNISLESAELRIKNQMSEKEYIERSDFVIYNNGDKVDLEREVLEIIEKVLKSE